jgi:hypothetical protein
MSFSPLTMELVRVLTSMRTAVPTRPAKAAISASVFASRAMPLARSMNSRAERAPPSIGAGGGAGGAEASPSAPPGARPSFRMPLISPSSCVTRAISAASCVA